MDAEVAETVVLPDNTIVDTSIPPPGFNYPKPDFTPVPSDDTSEVISPSDKPKPTFKNVLQAKKRLQAFSSNRAGSLPTSPLATKKTKSLSFEEKNEEGTSPVKKTPKKGTYHDDKAKAVIEEIEELKREELQRIHSVYIASRARSRSRSTSRSLDKERFKKVDKKSRNYRKRSATPEKAKKVHKKTKKYPKNWREFVEFDLNFDLNREFDVASPKGNNELLRQLLFESPSIPVTQFKMKTVKNEEKNVPFDFIRYTRTKPILAYSVNFVAIKEKYLPRKVILDALPKNYVANIENLHSNSLKFNLSTNDVTKARNWFPKIWRDSENECKILEKSVGLSFLQTYTGEEEENEFVEEEKKEQPDDKTKQVEEKKKQAEEKKEQPDEKKKQTEEKKEQPDEKKKQTEDKKGQPDEKKKQSEDKRESTGDKKEKTEKREESKNDKEQPPENENLESKNTKDDHKKKKKKKSHEEATEDKLEIISLEKKKKKKRDRKKSTDENTDETLGKKKKSKKSKSKKKEKRSKEKKTKHKKPLKEKKKKEKLLEEEKTIENKTKQQVLEELKIIEDKLAKKREQENKNKIKHEKEEKEKTRKRKHSEREDDAKRTKHDKHKIEHVRSEIVKIETPKPKPQESKIEKIEFPEIKSEEKSSKKHTEKIKAPKSEEFIERKEKSSPRKKKSRWSEPVKIEEIPFPEKMNIAEEIKRIDEVLKKHEENTRNHRLTGEQKIENITTIKEKTPDTDEYHSHWESDDDISHRRQKLKPNRSWESDEELFERKYNANKTQSESYTNLEIPLNIKTFSRRGKWNEEPPLSYIDTINELKLLEEERRNLSEERKKLEIEKQRILKMQEDKLEDKKPAIEQPKESTPTTPEPETVKVKKEILDINFDSLNNSLLSNVSSNESNFPIAVLENEYEEFIKAVSSDPSPAKKKPERRDSDDSTSSSSSSSSDSDHKKKKRKKKKKKKKKSRDCEGLLLGKGATFFNEFDIPVPSDLPEIVPTPVPVPSPILPVVAPNLLLKPIIDIKEPEGKDPGLDLTKPFVFSSIVLQSKKPALVESKLKLDDDSDSVDFTEKFVKKGEEPRKDEKPEIQEVEMPKLEDIELPKPIEEIKIETIQPPPEPEEKKEVLPEVVGIEEKDSPKKEVKVVVSEEKKPPPPENKIIEKPRKRSRTRSREKELRRRSPPRRREPTPLRRRYSSPLRRRSPGRRRPSPRRRSPSPRRRLSPPRRRRRSPSLSPPRRGLRKRTPSPRSRRASPLNSPLDGFKRSVADSTISDDMLPQPTPEDYNGSPYYERKKSRSSLSPQPSPKRISLDDRINQVLGLEKKEPPKPTESYTNYNNYNAYNQQYNQYTQYGQYGQQKSEYVAPFTQSFFTQPPPPIAKPVPPTKVVQVGNILQVVPSDEIPQPVIENKPPETSQKIVQVGNMLQIVPAVIPPPTPIPTPTKQILEPPPQPVQPPEKQSAEALMKQKLAERKAEREKRRQERERRRKEKEKKRKEKEKRKQMKLKLKTENMIKRAIQLEAEALACEDLEEEGDGAETPVQWPPVSVVVSTTPSCKGILLGDGSSRKRKSVQFADGVRPGEGTSPSGGEELSSPPPHPQKLPKEKRYKKIKVPKKSKKRKIKVKVVKKKTVQNADEDDDDEDDNLPPPSPPPGSPPPHVFPSRVKTHTINNVHQYVGNIMQNNPAGFPFRPPMPVVINRHQPPPGFIPGTYHADVNNLSHPSYQGVSSHH